MNKYLRLTFALAGAVALISALAPAALASPTTEAGPGNRPPDARDRAMSLSMNIPQWNTFLGTDLDEETLGFELLEGPSNGSLEVVSEVRHVGRVSWQWFKYTPANNFIGSDQVRFRATDSDGAVDEAKVEINVGAGEWSYKVYDVQATPPPGTYPDSVHVELSVPAIEPEWAEYYGQPDVRYTTDGTDPSCGGGAASSTVANVHLEHSATIRARACYPYGYSSPVASLSYVVERGEGDNQPPYAFPRYMRIVRNVPLGNTLLGRDLDGEPLTFEVLDGVDHGTLTLADHVTTTHGLSWVWAHYRPNRNYVGVDQLLYRVADQHGATATETAVFQVDAGEPFTFDVQPPVATPAAGEYPEPQTVTLVANTSTTPWGEVEIWFTKDGSDPSCGTGIQYTNPFGVPVDVTLRALACYPFGYSSDVASFSYAIRKPEASAASSQGAPLPLAFVPAAPVFLPSPVQQTAPPVSAAAPRVLGEKTCVPQPEPKQKLDARFARKFAGRILIKEQACGETWYVGPNTLRRYRLPLDPTAFRSVRGLVLKVGDSLLASAAAGKPAPGLRGRFLQAADGKLWYSSPVDGKLHDVSTVELLREAVSGTGAAVSNGEVAKIRRAGS